MLRQFSFRKGKITIDTMSEVIKCVKAGLGIEGVSAYSSPCTSAMLNDTSWLTLIDAMRCLGVEEYLIDNVKSYLLGRLVKI